jgi:hypothetical protein
MQIRRVGRQFDCLERHRPAGSPPCEHIRARLSGRVYTARDQAECRENLQLHLNGRAFAHQEPRFAFSHVSETRNTAIMSPMGSPAVAAIVSHVLFWALAIYGYAVRELKAKSVVVFMVAWLGGRFGLPYCRSAPPSSRRSWQCRILPWCSSSSRVLFGSPEGFDVAVQHPC